MDMEWFKHLSEIVRTITDLNEKLKIRDKMRTLKRGMETLVGMEVKISGERKRFSGTTWYGMTDDWLEKFEGLGHEVNDLVRKGTASTSVWQLKLESHLDKLISEVEQLQLQAKKIYFYLSASLDVEDDLTWDVEETRRFELPIGVVGEDFHSNLQNIWDYLMNEDVQIIGVQGIGGVGKTTLVKCIHNQILKNRAIFKGCCWVTVSRHYSVRKLQDAIAKHLCLDLENHNDEVIRQAILWRKLSSKTPVIVLDDVWEYIHLQTIGMPIGRNGCKVILITRKVNVCTEMNCDKLVNVRVLLEQEAWCLFRNNLRCGYLLSPNVEEIAKTMARECVGLPLGIVVLSSIMRGVNDIHEWQETLKEFQELKSKAEHMVEEVFPLLQFSYHHLKDSIMQQCFLHIALYLEDEAVDKEELIQYFIDSGLIKRGVTRRAEFDKGNAILNELVMSCLLAEDEGDSRFVKMHGLVREMVINITNDHFMVKAGQQMRKMPNEREWLESLEKVSLMHNAIIGIAQDASPQCPNISTLFLQRNPLIAVPNSFFRHMKALQILNLSSTKIKELPNSLSDLENLTALHLSYCQNLRFVPSLEKMRVLKTLNLYKCGIKDMPQGMEKLLSLVYLDLGGTEGLQGMQWPTGLLPQLSNLQYINFVEGPKVTKAEELINLRKLEHVRCSFHDANEYSTFMRYLWCRTPPHCKIDLRPCGSGHMMVDIKIEMQH